MDIKTQNQYLYNLLLSGKGITGYEAMVYHHIGGLRARISDLSLDYGVPIDRRLEPNTDNKGYHARYFISEENRELLKGTPLSKIPNFSNHE